MGLALALGALLLVAPAQSAVPLTPELAMELTLRVPAFAAASGRTDVQVRRLQSIPGSDDRAWWLELQWSEAQRTRTALALVGRADPGPDGREAPFKWVARHGVWGLGELQEDKDWDDLIADLLKARIASFESATIGTLRSLVSAEETFASQAEGAYGEPRCLVKPEGCWPAFQGEALVTEDAVEPERYGYRHRFHAGPRRSWTGQGPSPLLDSYAVTAVPLEAGGTGRRSFCADSRGAVCEYEDGREIGLAGASCPADCRCLDCDSAPPPPPSAASAPAAGEEVTIFDNGNLDGVLSEPMAPTTFTTSERFRVTFVMNYHWNDGAGAPAGTIALHDAEGKLVVAWRASGRDGQGGAPSAYWEARPEAFVLEPGTYTVRDSAVSTWSYNRGSKGQGITSIKGIRQQ